MTVCLHCNLPCRLTTGKKIYPHRKDLWEKPIWECSFCDAYVGCHPGTKDALGFAADYQTRQARMKLHNEMLDPIWRNSKGVKRNRRTVYAYLSRVMGLPPEETHTGMWTVEQCRQAWQALSGKTMKDIKEGMKP